MTEPYLNTAMSWLVARARAVERERRNVARRSPSASLKGWR
jgi:hypothetical protein